MSPGPIGPAPDTQVATVTQTAARTRLAPRYHVILFDDDKHTYQYVILMLMELFQKTAERAYQHAVEVDSTGRTIVDTTSFERAELKRDQIRAYGADPLIENSPGSMSAGIEPAE